MVLGNHCKFQWFWRDHCKFSMVFEETITIECFLAVWPMVFQWFLIWLPSLSMVFDGFGPLVKRCDGFDGSFHRFIMIMIHNNNINIINLPYPREMLLQRCLLAFCIHVIISSSSIKIVTDAQMWLSSPRAKRAGPKGLRAESARAVTGRRCPHSGVG